MAKFSKISSWKLFILFIFFSGLLTACDGLQDLAVIAQQESGTNNIGGSVTAPNISTGFSNPAANLINKDVLDKARAGATATQKALDKVAEITAQERSTPEATRRVATVTPQPEVIAEQEEQIKKRIDDLITLPTWS